MSAELIYRTSSPAMLAWLADFDRRWIERKFDLDELQQDIEAVIGIPDGEDGRSLYLQRGEVAGVFRSSDEWRNGNYAEQFPGWREHPSQDMLVPKRNTAAGKEWDRRFRALGHLEIRDEVPTIGIPSMIFSSDEHRMFEPGLEFDREAGRVLTMYQIWGSGRCAIQCENEQAKHPEVVWTEVPRSEWYARLEAKEAADA